MKQSEYFVYNGVNSQGLGITQVQVQSTDLYTEQFLGDISLLEIQIRRKKTPYFQGVNRTPLQFDLTFAFDEVANPGSFKQITQLFHTDTYQQFYTSDDTNRIWMCMPVNGSTVSHNGSGQGYVTVTMRCDSPYMYMPTVTTSEYDLSNQSYQEASQTNFLTGTLTNVGAPSNGLQLNQKSAPTFTRNSVANLGEEDGFAQVASGAPRYERGYFHNLLSDSIAVGGELDNGANFESDDSTKNVISYDTSQHWQGQGSIKSVEASNSGVGIRNNIYSIANLDITKSFIASAYILQQAGIEISFEVQFFNVNGYTSSVTPIIGTDVTKTGWQRVYCSFTPPSGTTGISYKFYTTQAQATATTFWIDGLQLEYAQKKDANGNWIPLDWILPSQGKGIFIEEGTTNLVQNSDFETVTTTTQVFGDDMTTGSAWTTQSGSTAYRTADVTNLVLNSDFETVTGTAQVFSDTMAVDQSAWTVQSGSVSETRTASTTNLVQNSDFETVTTTAQVFADDMTTNSAWTVQSGTTSQRASSTTNLVLNSDFETVTGTAQVFSDDMTTLTAWTTQSGSFTNTPAVTNLVENSDFETVTTTAQVFADALTSYTGTIVPAPWTLQSGSFTFGASGATSGANGSLMTAGNAQWKPVLGSDGTTKLVLTAQETITEPSVVPNGAGEVDLVVDLSNRYYAIVYSGVFYLSKYVGGTNTALAQVAQALTASTSYCITLSLDNTGLLTAKLYQGTNTTGTLLQTLTATDTSLTGGFQVGVGGDTGVIISNAKVTAPFANGWTISGDSRVAWALSQSAISGKYSVSAVGVNAGILGQAYENINVTSGQPYTLSAYMNSTNVGSTNGDNVSTFASGTTLSSTANVKGTTSTTRYSSTFTPSAGITNVNLYLNVDDSGTATFDSIQLETGSTMNNYVRNDSTSGSASVPAGATCGTTNSIAVAGNSSWKPLSGSGGQNLALTAQATFTTPSNWTSTSTMDLTLSQDGTSIGSANSDFYMIQTAYSNGANTLTLAKHVNTGTWTSLSSVSQALLPSTSYTITLSLDKNGLLTANLYQGQNTSGTLLHTLTATDTSLTGGFLVGVGGDSGVIVSGVSVDAPWADGWSRQGEGTVAWSLTTSNVENGKYAIGYVSKTASSASIFNSIGISNGTTYTASVYAIATTGSTAQLRISDQHVSGAIGGNTPISATTMTRYSQTFTGNSYATAGITLESTSVGTVTFDSIQLESGSTATQYIRNDSTTTSATAPAGTLFTANGTFITAGNPNWKPLLGSDGTTKLALSVQGSFTTSPTVPDDIHLYLYQDANNSYELRWQNDNNLVIYKTVGGSTTALKDDAFATKQLPSTTYTMTLSLDNTGLLTAKLYSGSSATGTPLQTLTTTDTSLTGGFLCGVGGDNGIIISGVSVSAPWANGWGLGGDSRASWSLSQSGVTNGKYAMTVVGLASATSYISTGSISVSSNTTYTISGYVTGQSVGSTVPYIEAYFRDSTGASTTSVDSMGIAGTSVSTRHSNFGSTTSTTTNAIINLVTRDVGTVTFDSIQLETGSTATLYIRNDSTSASATAPAGFVMGASSSVITAGNSAWKPLSGSGGQNLTLTGQATFTQPPIGTGNWSGVDLRVFIDKNNYYTAFHDGKTFYILKYVNGTQTNLTMSGAPLSPSTTYTVTFAIDKNGVLTANLYSGSSATGTPLKTLTATDTSLTGGFLVGVGGDTNVIVSNVKVTAPWADYWAIGGSNNDFRTAWSLTSSSQNGNYAISAVGVATGIEGYVQPASIAYTNGQALVMSAYVSTVNLAQGQASSHSGISLNTNIGASVSAPLGTNAYSRISVTDTPTSSGSNSSSLYINDAGTITFDSIQIETGSTPTLYIRNDSTTSSLTVPKGTVSGASGTLITAGNSNWEPLTGSDGTTKLSLTAQATFTTDAVVAGRSNGFVEFYVDSNNNYDAHITDSYFVLGKGINGTYSNITLVSFTPSPSTSYTVTLSLDPTGALTAKLYSGQNTSGTLLQTLTATDTSLSGGFLVGAGGDQNVTISGVSVNAPWANGWIVGGDTRVAWSLTKSAINGTYSVNAVGVAGVSGWVLTTEYTIPSSTSYTISNYQNTTNVGTSGAYANLNWFDSSGVILSGSTMTKITGTTSAQRYSEAFTSPSNAGRVSLGLNMLDTGSVTFDAIQLEQKTYATSYLRNDSTSASMVRNAESLNFSPTVDLTKGTISFRLNVNSNVKDTSMHRYAFSSSQSNGSNEIAFRHDTSNVWMFLTTDGSGNSSTVSTPDTLSDGWHHFAVTWSSSSIDLYIDGTKVGSTSTPHLPSTLSSNIYIGSWVDGAYGIINTDLGEFILYNEVLTDAQITSIANATSLQSVSEDTNAVMDFESNLTWAQGGYRITPSISLSWIKDVDKTSLSWTISTPTNTDFYCYTSIDGGATWQQATVNGGAIPSITSGMDLTGKTLLIKESFTMQDATSASVPVLSSLTASESGYLQLTNSGEIVCPYEIWITKVGAGDITVSNSTTGNTYKFTGLSDQEVVYVDMGAEYISSSLESTNNIYRYNNYNDVYDQLALGTNDLDITGNCKLQFRYVPRLVSTLPN